MARIEARENAESMPMEKTTAMTPDKERTKGMSRSNNGAAKLPKMIWGCRGQRSARNPKGIWNRPPAMKYTDMSYYVYEQDGIIECTTVMPPDGQHTTRWNDIDALVKFLEWNDLQETQEYMRDMTRG